jgi:hypothetical protein
VKPLSQYVDEALVRDLRAALAGGAFSGLSFEQANPLSLDAAWTFSATVETPCVGNGLPK